VRPVEFGWTNAASSNDYASRDMTPWSDARRYECGTLNTIGCFGLRASMDFILETGVERIAPVVQGLADQIADGVRAKGYVLSGERRPETGAGIVSFRKAGVDSVTVCTQLREQGIIAAPRAGWVRTSPHFYILPEEIDRMIGLLQ
jgi:cysteine desulfurase/selenocysteine lyase